MQDPAALPLPFLARDMLRFEGGAAFSLQIKTQSRRAATLTIRGMTREGTFSYKHTTTSDGTPQTQSYRIPDVPIMVSVVDEAGVYVHGESIVTLNLTVNGDTLFALCNGFVSSTRAISYPHTNWNDPIPGRGRFVTVAQAAGGAGNENTITVPSNRIWRIIAVDLQLVASATVANRRVRLRIQTNVGGDFVTFGNTDQTASQTMNYTIADVGAIPLEVNGTRYRMSLPAGIYLEQDDTISTDTINLQAGDNYTAMHVQVEEFFK